MDIQTFLTNVCQHSGIDGENLAVELTEADNIIQATIKVSQDESGLLIGFHGDTLSAIQRLTRVVFQEELQDKRLIVNVNEYREQRTDRLKQMAENAAHQVLETGRPYRFSSLPAHERFVIHSTISEDPTFADLQSVSEGEGRARVLIIRPKTTSSSSHTDVDRGAGMEAGTEEETSDQAV